MADIDPTMAKALIAQAGLEAVYAAYPEDVLTALEQAINYNEAIARLDIGMAVPGATYLPGADR